MVQLGLSASVFVLFTSFSFSVSAGSLARWSAGQTRATISPTQSAGPGPCDSICDSTEDYLHNACGGLVVPCACTEIVTRVEEACTRCELSNLANSTQVELARISVQKDFGEFQASCAQAEHPIPAMNLDDIELFEDPISFMFEIPQDMSDPSFPDYIGAVCLRPDQIDIFQCFVGGVSWRRCPNNDVAGILVRVSTYLANLLLGIIVMYNPAESSTAVWTQLLTVYSLLVSGIIAITKDGLTRFHAEMTIFLVMSPLSSTLVVYAIRGFLGRPHRLDSILSSRRKHLLPRLLVIGFATISLGLVIFTNTADTHHFSENPCELDGDYKTTVGLLRNLLFIPYAGVVLVILSLSLTTNVGEVVGVSIFLVPFILLLVGFIFAVIRQRHCLAKQFRIQSSRWKLWVAWNVLAAQYPFLHFHGVFFVPMFYWILALEVKLVGTPDNLFSLTFGQILAMFVVLPPLLQVLQMVPEAKPWFLNLAVVRLFTRRPRALPATPFSLEDGIPEKADDPLKDSIQSQELYLPNHRV